MLTYDIYFVGHKALRGDVVQATLKAIWDNIEKLPDGRAGIGQWRHSDLRAAVR